MSQPDPLAEWIPGLKTGDREAARQLWERLWESFVRLARTQLRKPRGVADEEDVANSAFDSFCRGAKEGKFAQLEDGGDLWGIMGMLIARKAADLLRREGAAKRGGGRVKDEAALAGGDPDAEGSPLDNLAGKALPPDLLLELDEEYRRLLNTLADDQMRAIALLKMDGYKDREIASELGVSVATVRRRVDLIRRKWQQEGVGPDRPKE
jgi:DNA-directed RNA polymerase specialized sigma24 family protein